MPIDAETRGAVVKKARLFDAAKNKIEERIRSNVRMAIGKLQSAERELLDEVEIEFGENPFSYFLSVDDHTEGEIESILSKEIPRNFGPSEESFFSLCREIESFKSWEKKMTLTDLIPQNLRYTDVTWDTITVLWDAFDLDSISFYEIELRSSSTKNVYHSAKTQYTFSGLDSGTKYHICVRAISSQNSNYWSDSITVQTEKEPFTWKKCPFFVSEKRKYFADENNSRIATKVGGDEFCTVVDNVSIPLNKTVSWGIKILKSKRNDGDGILIGIAPFDINLDEVYNREKCGWYFDCRNSRLHSGPPHNYKGKEYGPRKGDGEYVRTGGSVGVVMDTTKGELSFVVNGVNLGVAYEGIPIDKPLVPCVLLCYQGDSVELDISEVKENVDSSIPVPSNIMAMNGTTWDFITLIWNGVEGASFYQIEVDGSKQWEMSTTNEFTKRGFLPDTEHAFRVRAVSGNSVSEWSDIVRGRTQKEADFSECIWKECPDQVYKKRKYSVDEKNPRIAHIKSITTVQSNQNIPQNPFRPQSAYTPNDNLSTMIGSTPLPLNKVTSWSIKILRSGKNNGGRIYIGVVPSDIDQNGGGNFNKCGWYFDCRRSKLWSGPPHNYRDKEYGPRKGFFGGQYVHTGNSVGVVMDTAKGELSFVLNGVNLGVAYEGIPLDKPLVPCVLLYNEGGSIELVI